MQKHPQFTEEQIEAAKKFFVEAKTANAERDQLAKSIATSLAPRRGARRL